MKVLIADALPEQAETALRDAGYAVAVDVTLKQESLRDAVAASGADVLVVRSTQVPRDVLAAGSLSLVIRAGAGVNNVDVGAASELGVQVANCPGQNAIAVAELTFGLILALDRRIPENVAAIKAGEWNKKAFSKARGLHGRTLGIVGLGRIGLQVVQRAHAFGMHVVAWSRSLTPEWAEGLGIECVAIPEDVARKADIVTTHLALNDETRGVLGGSFFSSMRPGTLFVNTARGPVVDAAALELAVRDGGVRAGLDVWWQQPGSSTGSFEDPIGALEGVYGTHHIGASTDQAQEAVAAEAVQVAIVFKETGAVPNCVNIAEESQAPCALVVRHRDRVGVLAHVLDHLQRAHVNVQEIQNVIFDGGRTACATLRMHEEPSAEVLAAIDAHEHVLSTRVAR